MLFDLDKLVRKATKKETPQASIRSSLLYCHDTMHPKHIDMGYDYLLVIDLAELGARHKCILWERSQGQAVHGLNLFYLIPYL